VKRAGHAAPIRRRRPTTLLRFAGVVALGYAAMAWATGCRDGGDVGRLERGGQAYLAQCAVCHGAEGAGDGPLAASIAAEGKSPPAALDSARVASLGLAGVREAIETGAHVRAGSPMPVWGLHLGPEWMDAIAEYVVAMPATGEAGRNRIDRYLAAPAGSPPSGRRVYVTYCSSCHGPNARGDGFFSADFTPKLRPPRLDGAALSAFDEAGLMRLVSVGGAHTPEALTTPGWLYTISPDDRRALAGYLRTLAKRD
jgi:mono/diheme cytochrome c family protein